MVWLAQATTVPFSVHRRPLMTWWQGRPRFAVYRRPPMAYWQ